MRSHSRFTLYWLLTLEVLLPKGWRGIVPMTSGSSRHSLDVPGTSTQTCCKEKGGRISRVRCRLKATSSRGGEAHLEHVLHFDDATVQDGGTHWRDLDGSAVPCLPAFSAHDVSAERAHHSSLLLHGAASDERLCLDDVGFGHHRPGGGVVKLSKHRYHLACGGGEARQEPQTLKALRSGGVGRPTHPGCSLCGRSLQSRTPVRNFCTTPVPSCLLFQPAVPDDGDHEMTFSTHKNIKCDIMVKGERSAAHQ